MSYKVKMKRNTNAEKYASSVWSLEPSCANEKNYLDVKTIKRKPKREKKSQTFQDSNR